MTKYGILFLVAAVGIGLSQPVQGQSAVEVNTVEAVAGTTATIEISLRTDRADVAGTLNRVEWGPPLNVVSCVANAAIDRPATDFAFSPQGCPPGECTEFGAVVLGFDIVPLTDGDVLYRCDVEVALGTAVGSYPLVCTFAEVGTVDATTIEADCINGAVQVIEALPTATATATEAEMTATPTIETQPTITATPPPPCPGDCDGNGRVAINELVLAVRIALGAAGVDDCSAADGNGDGDITISELVRAVRSALEGC